MDIYTQKQQEEDLKREERLQSSVLWKWFYFLEDKIGDFANSRVEGREKKYAIVGFIAMMLDTFTTHFFLHYNLGYEANYLPAKFYNAGLVLEFEFLKWLAVAFIVSYNYICATRGWTKTERAGGRTGLLVLYGIFGAVVIWNICLSIFSLFMGGTA